MSMLNNPQAEQQWNGPYSRRLKRLVSLAYGERLTQDVSVAFDSAQYGLGRMLEQQVSILEAMIDQRQMHAHQPHRYRRPVKYFKVELKHYRTALRCWELEVADWWEQLPAQQTTCQPADAH